MTESELFRAADAARARLNAEARSRGEASLAQNQQEQRARLEHKRRKDESDLRARGFIDIVKKHGIPSSRVKVKVRYKMVNDSGYRSGTAKYKKYSYERGWVTREAVIGKDVKRDKNEHLISPAISPVPPLVLLEDGRTIEAYSSYGQPGDPIEVDGGWKTDMDKIFNETAYAGAYGLSILGTRLAQLGLA